MSGIPPDIPPPPSAWPSPPPRARPRPLVVVGIGVVVAGFLGIVVVLGFAVAGNRPVHPSLGRREAPGVTSPTRAASAEPVSIVTATFPHAAFDNHLRFVVNMGRRTSPGCTSHYIRKRLAYLDHCGGRHTHGARFVEIAIALWNNTLAPSPYSLENFTLVSRNNAILYPWNPALLPSTAGLLPASGVVAPRTWVTGWLVFSDYGMTPSRVVYADASRTLSIRFGG